MAKLLKRWYVWLGLVLLLGLAGSVAMILANPSQITQANFDRIARIPSCRGANSFRQDDGTRISYDDLNDHHMPP